MSVDTSLRRSRLLGVARELIRDTPGTYEQIMRDHPEVGPVPLGILGGRLRMFLVNHPDGVEQVLTASGREYLKDAPYYREIAAYLGDALLTSEGAKWRQQRRTLAPLFTPRRVATYASAMAAEAERVADRWRQAARTTADTTVDLNSDLTELTLRVVARVLFGTNVDAAVPAVRDLLPILSEHIRDRAFSPVSLPRWVPTPAQRRAIRAQQTLYSVVDGIVEERRNGKGGGDGEDLVSLLLAARDPETGQPLSATEVRDQALIFLLAGHETTSTLLTFALHLLGHHHQEQDRLRQEAHDVLGDRDPTAADAATLTRTGMVIREALRLYPPAFAFGRVTHTGDVVCGHQIPPGSVVVVAPWTLHRHPDFWPDPLRFAPDRFEPGAVAGRHKYAYLPFSGGPRNCIGNHFALLEATIALATIVRAVRVDTDPAPVPLSAGTTLRPSGAVPARLRVADPGNGTLMRPCG